MEAAAEEVEAVEAAAEVVVEGVEEAAVVDKTLNECRSTNAEIREYKCHADSRNVIPNSSKTAGLRHEMGTFAGNLEYIDEHICAQLPSLCHVNTVMQISSTPNPIIVMCQHCMILAQV